MTGRRTVPGRQTEEAGGAGRSWECITQQGHGGWPEREAAYWQPVHWEERGPERGGNGHK